MTSSVSSGSWMQRGQPGGGAGPWPRGRRSTCAVSPSSLPAGPPRACPAPCPSSPRPPALTVLLVPAPVPSAFRPGGCPAQARLVFGGTCDRFPLSVGGTQRRTSLRSHGDAARPTGLPAAITQTGRRPLLPAWGRRVSEPFHTRGPRPAPPRGRLSNPRFPRPRPVSDTRSFRQPCRSPPEGLGIAC